ncbi:MAG: zf-HC2 domain-containing protein [Chloroflexaceae bacterium]|jgi:hypothetical protein|nr:zf-HC2 domain-containing protein [Chloroflexaceae bacterium]
MECRSVQEQLRTGAVESLPPARRAAVQAHLATCPACRRERELIMQLDQRLYAAVAATPVRGFAQTRQLIQGRGTQTRVRLRRLGLAVGRGLRPLVASLAVGMTVLVLAVALATSMGYPPARTLVQLLVAPFGLDSPTLPVLPLAGDRVWIEGMSPESGTPLQNNGEITVQVGYTLASASDGVISLRLVGGADGQTRYFVEPVAVRGGTNRVTFRFTLDEARALQVLGPGPARLEVTLRSWLGTNEARLLTRVAPGEWQVVVPGR